MGNLNISYPIYDSNQPGNILSPTIINAYSALSIPAYWRAVNFLSANLARFPRTVHKAGSPVAGKHPLDKFLERRPNQYQTAAVFWRQFFFEAVNEGNAYAKILRVPNTPAIIGLYNLLPTEVTPFRYQGVQYYFDGRAKEVLAGEDVLHLSGLGYDGMLGYSPVVLLRETYQRARTIDQYQSRFLQKGTVVRGSIEIPIGVSDEKLEDIQKKLRNYFQGAGAERDVLMLSDGAKLNNSTLSPQASQLIEQMAYSVKQIAQITGVPPQFLYEYGESKYIDTIEQMGQDVVRYTFGPWIDQMEDELSAKLLTEQEQESDTKIRLDPNVLLRGDTKTQSDVMNAQKSAGIRTANEARAVLDLPRLEDPEADKLKTSGDTMVRPQAPDSNPAAVKSSSAAPAGQDVFTALQPMLDAACARVEAKTHKAFASRESKPSQERTIWANVFAEEQARYASEALTPICAALGTLAGLQVDVEGAAKRYAAGIRKRAADGTVRDLKSILGEVRDAQCEQKAA